MEQQSIKHKYRYIAIINVYDANREHGIRIVDIGNVYTGNLLLLWDKDIFERYKRQIIKDYPNMLIGVRKRRESE